MNRELGLLALLDVLGAPVPRRNFLLVDFIELIKTVAELGINGTSIGQAERPASTNSIRPGDHFVRIRLQMHDRLLPISVSKLRMIALVYRAQHHGARTKIERYVVSNAVARMALHRE